MLCFVDSNRKFHSPVHLLSVPFDDKTYFMPATLKKDSTSDKTDNNIAQSSGSADDHSSEIISFVAHELKNPLSSIRGYTDLLLSDALGSLNPQQKQFLITIQANVIRMGELIADLAEVSLVETNRMKLNKVTFSIPSLIGEITELLHPQFVAKELVFLTNIEEDLPLLHTDKRRICQILINLVGNAVKYSLSGGKVELSVQKVFTGDTNSIQFSVKDSGIGIKDNDKKWIFQRYFRADDVQSRDIPGTGLGLYITKRLVEILGGEIWFESEFSQGSVFSFTLPVE